MTNNVIVLLFSYVMIGLIGSGFGGLMSRYKEDKPIDIADLLKRVLLFIPYILIGVILHVWKDFRNHKAGYIVIILVIAFLGFGVYMGIMAGPSPPAPMD